jgi:hypothetical protein
MRGGRSIFGLEVEEALLREIYFRRDFDVGILMLGEIFLIRADINESIFGITIPSTLS